MANLTSITLSSGNVTSSGSFSTIDNSFGTAGTSNINVLSVQGVSGGVAQLISGTVSLASSTVTLAGTSNVSVVNGITSVVVSGTSNVTVVNSNTNGRKTPVNSAPVVLNSMSYTTVAASSATTLLGSTGAVGDYIDGVLVIPTTVSPGSLSISDSTTAISIFAGGTTSLTNLVSFYIPVGAVSALGGWHMSTGSGLGVITIGNFT